MVHRQSDHIFMRKEPQPIRLWRMPNMHDYYCVCCVYVCDKCPCKTRNSYHQCVFFLLSGPCIKYWKSVTFQLRTNNMLRMTYQNILYAQNCFVSFTFLCAIHRSAWVSSILFTIKTNIITWTDAILRTMNCRLFSDIGILRFSHKICVNSIRSANL